MFSLLKKELTQFFGSLTGYVVIAVFLIITSLFLWVFEGNYNIPDGGYATLNGLFDLAPWIYLFLIPAITMRLFAEERKSGTLELLYTRPISAFWLVMGKFLASLLVVVMSLLPTLIWYFSVYWLGSPVGSIDSGATWGSFIGLFFLAVIYLTIGLFTSSLTENQIVAFLLAMIVAFFWFAGFGFIADLQVPATISSFLVSLGIQSHYESVSRGVLDSRDLLYFILMSGFFILLTQISLSWRKQSARRSLVTVVLYSLGAAVVAIFTSGSFFRIDFTSEKRYTLSGQTISIVQKASGPVAVDLFLEGELPPAFRRLQSEVIDKLNDIEQYCGQPIYLRRVDPYQESTPEERKSYFESLMKRGVLPTDLRIKTDQGISTKWIFPSAIIRSGEYEIAVNFLKNDPALSEEENLNHTAELLEYEIVRALNILFQPKKDKVAFLTGHDELDEWQLRDFTHALSENYDVTFLRASQLNDSIKAVIIARPEQPFSEPDKFAIDQYLMRGGNLMWLIDPVKVSLDSLSEGMTTLAFPADYNLNDQLFKYGVRLNHNLIQDVACLQIRINTALNGQPAKYSLAPWYFSPLLMPVQSHPVGKNVNRVMAEFASSLEPVGDNPNVSSTVILTSSPYARLNESPMLVSLGMIDAPPARELFTLADIPAGILLEGRFGSVFRNRMVEGIGLPAGTEVIGESQFARMMVFSDGGLIANKVNRLPSGNRILPLGFDRVSSVTFGNKEFFVNAVNYLCDGNGLMQLRSRTMQLRLLDKVKLRETGKIWQLVNVAFPVIMIVAGGVVFQFLRRRRSRSFLK